MAHMFRLSPPTQTNFEKKKRKRKLMSSPTKEQVRKQCFPDPSHQKSLLRGGQVCRRQMDTHMYMACSKTWNFCYIFSPHQTETRRWSFGDRCAVYSFLDFFGICSDELESSSESDALEEALDSGLGFLPCFFVPCFFVSFFLLFLSLSCPS